MRIAQENNLLYTDIRQVATNLTNSQIVIHNHYAKTIRNPTTIRMMLTIATTFQFTYYTTFKSKSKYFATYGLWHFHATMLSVYPIFYFHIPYPLYHGSDGTLGVGGGRLRVGVIITFHFT